MLHLGVVVIHLRSPLFPGILARSPLRSPLPFQVRRLRSPLPQSTFFQAVHLRSPLFLPGNPLAQSTSLSRQSTSAVHFTFQAIHFRNPLHFPGNPLSQSTSLSRQSTSAVHFSRSPLRSPLFPSLLFLFSCKSYFQN